MKKKSVSCNDLKSLKLNQPFRVAIGSVSEFWGLPDYGTPGFSPLDCESTAAAPVRGGKRLLEGAAELRLLVVSESPVGLLVTNLSERSAAKANGLMTRTSIHVMFRKKIREGKTRGRLQWPCFALKLNVIMLAH